MGVYSEILWDVLCREVGKLRIERKEGAALQMPRTVGSGDGVTVPLHPESSIRIDKRKKREPAGIESIEGGVQRGDRSGHRQPRNRSFQQISDLRGCVIAPGYVYTGLES